MRRRRIILDESTSSSRGEREGWDLSRHAASSELRNALMWWTVSIADSHIGSGYVLSRQQRWKFT